MGARYRRNTVGDAVQPAKPFNIAAAYAATAKRWDLVKLDANGELVAVANADTAILGSLEAVHIKIPGDIDSGDVRFSTGAIFEMPVTGGVPKVGVAYGILATDGGTVNVADITTTAVKVVAIRSNGNVDVQITGRQLA